MQESGPFASGHPLSFRSAPTGRSHEEHAAGAERASHVYGAPCVSTLNHLACQCQTHAGALASHGISGAQLLKFLEQLRLIHFRRSPAPRCRTSLSHRPIVSMDCSNAYVAI